MSLTIRREVKGTDRIVRDLYRCNYEVLSAKSAGTAERLWRHERHLLWKNVFPRSVLVCDDNSLLKQYRFNQMVGKGNAIFGIFFLCGLSEEDFTDLPAG